MVKFFWQDFPVDITDLIFAPKFGIGKFSITGCCSQCLAMASDWCDGLFTEKTDPNKTRSSLLGATGLSRPSDTHLRHPSVPSDALCQGPPDSRMQKNFLASRKVYKLPKFESWEIFDQCLLAIHGWVCRDVAVPFAASESCRNGKQLIWDTHVSANGPNFGMHLTRAREVWEKQNLEFTEQVVITSNGFEPKLVGLALDGIIKWSNRSRTTMSSKHKSNHLTFLPSILLH